MSNVTSALNFILTKVILVVKEHRWDKAICHPHLVTAAWTPLSSLMEYIAVPKIYGSWGFIF